MIPGRRAQRMVRLAAGIHGGYEWAGTAGAQTHA